MRALLSHLVTPVLLSTGAPVTPSAAALCRRTGSRSRGCRGAMELFP